MESDNNYSMTIAVEFMADILLHYEAFIVGLVDIYHSMLKEEELSQPRQSDLLEVQIICVCLNAISKSEPTTVVQENGEVKLVFDADKAIGSMNKKEMVAFGLFDNDEHADLVLEEAKKRVGRIRRIIESLLIKSQDIINATLHED